MYVYARIQTDNSLIFYSTEEPLMTGSNIVSAWYLVGQWMSQTLNSCQCTIYNPME